MVSKTILVVDDEPSVRDIAALILKNAGYQVLTAKDGEDGMRVLENRATDISLLLTDVQMPKLDGLGLARAARALKPDLGIVFMSGYSPTNGVSKAVEDWNSQFLPKPFSLEKL